MDLENFVIEDLFYVEKKVFVVGWDVCYKVWFCFIFCFVVFVSLGYWYEGCIFYVFYFC